MSELGKHKYAMTKAWKLLGIIPATSFHTTLDGPLWHTIFGPEYGVTVKFIGNVWVCRKRYALEPIGMGDTPLAAMLQGWKHYQAYREECRQRTKCKLLEAADELDRCYAAAAQFDQAPKNREYARWQPEDELRRAALDHKGQP